MTDTVRKSSVHEEQIKALFSDLVKVEATKDWTRGLKIANKILDLCQTNVNAIHCKIVCLLKLEKFEEARNLILKHSGPKLDLSFEKAYAEYRMGKYALSLETLKSHEVKTLNEKELLAQVLYRLENYEESTKLFEELYEQKNDDFQNERLTNMLAAKCGLFLTKDSSFENPSIPETTYELCFNSACALLANREYSKAEQKLLKAESICRQIMQEEGDITEEEMDAELGVIRVQLAFSLQMQGKVNESFDLYTRVLKSKPSDDILLAIVRNNLIALNKEHGHSDSKKKMKTIFNKESFEKFNKYQKRDLIYNEALQACRTNQADACSSLLSELKKYDCCDDVALLHVCMLLKEKQVAKAIESIKNSMDGFTRAEQRSYIILLLVQLYLNQGKYLEAVQTVMKYNDVKYKPAMITLLVSILTRFLSNRPELLKGYLQECVDWYEKHHPESSFFPSLLKLSASHNVLNDDNITRSVSLLKKLQALRPNDIQVLRQLILITSQHDPDYAQELIKNMPSLAELSQGIDTDALEQTFNRRPAKAAQQAEAPTLKAPTDQTKKRRKKCKRVRLPKNYDPNVLPDPERWLPMKERSYYRGKKRKKMVFTKGTQGAAAPEGEQWGITNKPIASQPQPSAKPPPKQPVVQRHVARRKKKGGGKW